MINTPNNNLNTYEIIENNEGEMMVMLYAHPNTPQNPSFHLNEKKHCLELNRNSEQTIVIEDIAEDYVEKIKKQTNLYVCELAYSEAENDESEIVHAYVVPLKK